MKHVSTKILRDKAVILSVIRTFGSLSRVDINRLTHFRPSTISLLVRQMLKEGSIREAGTSNNPFGRKQVLLALQENLGYIVGIEFDPDFVTAAAMDLKPKILSEVRENTFLAGGPAGLIRQLVACAKSVMIKAGFEGKKPLGVALADAGVVNSREGIAVHMADIDFWKEVPLKEVFERECGCPFLLESNTRARTIAERALGAGQMADNLIFIDYRAGIGAGIFADGRMIRGHVESAGEFGHTHVIQDGPACKCGSFGCLEAMVGASAIGARARRAVEQGGTSLVLELAGDIDKITGWTVLEAANQGDKMCMSLVEDVGQYLGLGIANLVNLFNPSVVILSSSMKLAGQLLLDRISWVVKRQSLRYSVENLDIRYGSLGDESGVLGAGLVILEHLFEIPALKSPKFLVDPSPRIALSAASAGANKS